MLEISCVLCGAPIEDVNHPNAWFRKFRVVYTVVGEWKGARLSGVGERREVGDFIPLDDSIDRDLLGIGLDEYEANIDLILTDFYRNLPPGHPLAPSLTWGFPFHTGCWEILSNVCTMFRTGLDLQVLFDLCRSHPNKGGLLDWGHGYNGIVIHIVDTKDLCPGEEPDMCKRLLKTQVWKYEPLDIPELRRLFTSGSVCEPQKDSRNPFEMARPYRCEGDPFIKLPSEILQMILMLMDSKDVANLRLASPVYASPALPDQFWRSRFWRGREFEHIFEARESHPDNGSWRQLYEQIKTLSSMDSMVNRKRVWKLASYLRKLVDRKRGSDCCHGTPLRSLFEPDGVLDNYLWLSASPPLYSAAKEFREGSRSLYDRETSLPEDCKNIFISTISMNNKIYISGIRFVYGNDSCRLFGYCYSDEETMVTWETRQEPEGLLGFHVAFDFKGICGLRIISQAGELSDWIGNWRDLSQRVLSLPGQTPVRYLKGGFDALKLVSISISDGEDALPGSDSAYIHLPSSLRENSLWHGQIPPKELALLGYSQESYGYEGIPFSLTLFGGTDGSQLPYLSGLSVYVKDTYPYNPIRYTTNIWAIEFSFSHPVEGKNSILLGKIPNMKYPGMEVHHIALKSDQGERITRLDALYDDDEVTMVSMKICTNHGGVFSFPPCAVMVFGESYTPHVLKPEGTIVGLFSCLDSRVGLRTLGIAYVPSQCASVEAVVS